MYHLFACLSQMIQCECFEGEEQYCHALCHYAMPQRAKSKFATPAHWMV